MISTEVLMPASSDPDFKFDDAIAADELGLLELTFA
jgi:hypothetical protein